MLVNGRTDRNMEGVLNSGLMVLCSRDIGEITWLMVKADLFIAMVMFL